MGRFVGGVSTKLRVLGNPAIFVLTPGRDADVTRAGPSIDSLWDRPRRP